MNKLKRAVVAASVVLTSLVLGQSSAAVYSNSTPISIPDNNVAGITSTITVNDHFVITDVDVLVSILHTFDFDLAINLTHGAHTVDLSSRNGGAGDNYTNTLFNDSAATSITSGAAPFTGGTFDIVNGTGSIGGFRPETPLSVFNGEDAFGVWTLRVQDPFIGDVGTLQVWRLGISGKSITNVPEPASFTLLGLGLLGLRFARHKKVKA